MDSSLWFAFIAISVGTFAMRALPLLWMQRHLEKHEDGDAVNHMPTWLNVLGPMMIAAMLGVSLVPGTNTLESWLATLCGSVVTFLVWRKVKALGLPVFLGVLTYGVIIAMW